MKTILEHVLSIIYYIWFGLVFLGFHVVGLFANAGGNRKSLLKAVEYFCLFIIRGLLILNNRVKFINSYTIPRGRPLLIVTNHQSIYDIPPIIWYLRRHHPLFVAKKELSRGVPFVSYVLRHSGAALIDRSNSRQALKAISDMADIAHREQLSMVIFPEGTRSRNGRVKTFAWKGLATLLKRCPDALIVPIAINNTWKLHQNKGFAISAGNKLTWKVLEPLEPGGRNVEELTLELHDRIAREVARG